MLIDVVSVTPGLDFQLDLEFKNGERRRFDMRPLLKLKPWNRIAKLPLFERARVDYGTVVWPGEIDIAPETLYDDSAPLTTLDDLEIKRTVEKRRGEKSIQVSLDDL